MMAAGLPCGQPAARWHACAEAAGWRGLVLGNRAGGPGGRRGSAKEPAPKASLPLPLHPRCDHDRRPPPRKALPRINSERTPAGGARAVRARTHVEMERRRWVRRSPGAGGDDIIAVRQNRALHSATFARRRETSRIFRISCVATRAIALCRFAQPAGPPVDLTDHGASARRRRRHEAGDPLAGWIAAAGGGGGNFFFFSA